MEKPNYSIRDLETYLLAKKSGQTNPKIEQHINSDSFLKTVVVGLEKKLENNQDLSVAENLEAKKQESWSRLQPQVFLHNNTITKTQKTSFTETLSNYFSLKYYNPYFLRIHLLLGFNCSCVFVLVLIACWLNNSEDATLLVSHLDELVGYRP